MPSQAYFEELTGAVLADADEVKGFLPQQSPEELRDLHAGMQARIVETFTQLLEVELEDVGKLPEWRGRVERMQGNAQAEAGAATQAQALEELDAFLRDALPHYDAFLLKAGLRIRKAFVRTLTR